MRVSVDPSLPQAKRGLLRDILAMDLSQEPEKVQDFLLNEGRHEAVIAAEDVLKGGLAAVKAFVSKECQRLGGDHVEIEALFRWTDATYPGWRDV